MQVLPKIAKPSLSIVRLLLFFFSLILVGFTLLQTNDSLFSAVTYRPLALLLVFLLLPVNVFLEALRWQKISSRTADLQFKESLQIVLGGMAAGFLTPMRLGEYWSRAVTTRSGTKVQLVLLQLVSGYLMFFTTMLMTIIALVYSDVFFLPEVMKSLPEFSDGILAVIIFLVSSFVFLFSFLPRWNAIQVSASGILLTAGFSFLRYGVFVVQYLLAFEWLGVQVSPGDLIWSVVLFLGVVTVLPSFILSRLGIREAAAILVIGNPYGIEAQVVMVSLLLWIVNQVIPALTGAWLFRVSPEKPRK